MPRSPRNSVLVPGVAALSRSQAYRKKLLWKRKKLAKPGPKLPAPATKTVKVGGPKNGASRSLPIVKHRFYPADPVRAPKASRKAAPRPATLRANITPGTVLILLAGRFRGKRVVFLKQLDSGLLLVSGPKKINGVPLRRVNQAYVIATSTKLDLAALKLDQKINDAYFKREKLEKKRATAKELLDEPEKKQVSPERVKDQKTVDSQLLAIIKKTPLLKAYLNSSFALDKGQYPHALKF